MGKERKEKGEKVNEGRVQDAAYFERRRKNNDAAKRSRDARRQKEEAVAARAALLEQENLQLRSQVTPPLNLVTVSVEGSTAEE